LTSNKTSKKNVFGARGRREEVRSGQVIELSRAGLEWATKEKKKIRLKGVRETKARSVYG